MAKKITGKMIGEAVIMGAGVIVGTPIVANALSIPDIFDLKFITVGTALVAGGIAFGLELVLEKWYR